METGTATIAIVAVIAVVALTAMRISRAEARRRLLHQERMAAIEKGVPLPEDIDIETSAAPKTAGREPALHGTILTALGLGMLASSRLVPRTGLPNEIQEVVSFLEVWAYPATFIGIGLLVFAFFSRRASR